MGSVLDFFATYALHGRQCPRSSPAERTPAVPSSDNATRPGPEKGNRPALDWENKLLDLMQRVHVLQCRVRQESSLGAHGITDAVQIWNELASWTPNEHAPQEQQLLCRACQSAIFIWVYFLMHPDDLSGWKPQEALQDILSSLAGVETPEFAPLILIPLFFGGLIAIQPDDRDVVTEVYEQLAVVTQHQVFRDSWRMVQGVWEEYDEGNRKNWDWLK